MQSWRQISNNKYINPESRKLNYLNSNKIECNQNISIKPNNESTSQNKVLNLQKNNNGLWINSYFSPGSWNPMVGDGDKGIIFSNGTTPASKDTGNLVIGPWSDSQKGIKIVGSSGNIGINTSSPTATLDVNGIITSKSFTINGVDITTIGYEQIWNTYDTNQRDKAILYANFQKAMQMNVGINNNDANTATFVIQVADNSDLTNNLYIARGYTSSSITSCNLSAIIPYGWYYRVMKLGDATGSDNWTIDYWAELR